MYPSSDMNIEQINLAIGSSPVHSGGTESQAA